MIGMLLMAKLMAAVLFGFAFIIWVLACKESGITKIIGQILAIIIILLVILVSVYGVIRGCPMSKCCCPMMGKCKMHSMDKTKMMKMHDKSMKMDEKSGKCKTGEKK